MALDIIFNKKNHNFDSTEFNALKLSCLQVDNSIDKLYEDLSVIDRVALSGAIMFFLQHVEDKNIQETLRNKFPSGIVEKAEKYAELFAEKEKLLELINKKSREIASFCKFNFLIPFFNYGENCSDKEITKEKVQALVEVCGKVLNNHDLAAELLPTQNGFCFGSTEYDDCYFENVKITLDEFQKILDDTDWENEVVEMHCWW